MTTRFLAFPLAGALLACASPALAQVADTGWFAGIGAGRLHTTFTPYYTYYAGGTPDEFENKASGFEIDVLAGRRYRLSERVALSLQGNAAINTFTWSLSIPEEPAALEYSLPYRFTVSASPELHLGRVSLFGDFGGGLGRVHQRKTSSSASAYDFDRMRPMLSIGAGVRVTAAARTDLFVRVGQVRYASHQFDTFTATSVRVEHVKDAPRAMGFTVGMTRRF